MASQACKDTDTVEEVDVDAAIEPESECSVEVSLLPQPHQLQQRVLVSPSPPHAPGVHFPAPLSPAKPQMNGHTLVQPARPVALPIQPSPCVPDILQEQAPIMANGNFSASWQRRACRAQASEKSLPRASAFAPAVVEALLPPPLRMDAGFTRVWQRPLGVRFAPYPCIRPAILPHNHNPVCSMVEMPLPRPQFRSKATFPVLRKLEETGSGTSPGPMLEPGRSPFSKAGLPRSAVAAPPLRVLSGRPKIPKRIVGGMPCLRRPIKGSVRQSDAHALNWQKVWPMWVEVRGALRQVSPLLRQSGRDGACSLEPSVGCDSSSLLGHHPATACIFA